MGSSIRRACATGLAAVGLSMAAWALFGDGAGEADGALRGTDDPHAAASVGPSRVSPAYRRATLGGVPPTFDFVEHWSAPLFARGLARGDFNGDGRDDLVAMGEPLGDGRTAARVYLFLQTPAGAFAPPEIIELPRAIVSMTVIGLGVGDLNEDGKDDLAVTTSTRGAGLLTMLSVPGGSFRWGVDHWNDGQPSYAVPQLVDQDGDGHLDVLLAVGDLESDEHDPQPSQLATWYGDGQGAFARHVAIETGGYNQGLALGQLDGFGPPDLLAVTEGMGTPPVVHYPDGAGAWLPAAQLPAFEDEDALAFDQNSFINGAAFDANGDGRDDAVLNLGGPTRRLGIHLQEVDGTLSPQRHLLASGAAGFLDRPVDLDGNGHVDLVQAGYGANGPSLAYLLQDAYGLDYPVVQAVDPAFEMNSAMALVVGDFNGDGIADVVTSASGPGLRMWRGRLTPYAGAGGLPAPPTVVAALGSADHVMGSVDVTLAAPDDTGGLPISGYTVYAVPGGGIDADAGSPALVHRMTGLAPGSEYRFRARATNAAGKGPPSDLSAALQVPDFPVMLTIYTDASVGEPDLGSTTLMLRPWLLRPAPAGGVSFTLSTEDGSAHAGSDYEALAPTTLTIPAGQRSGPQVAVTVHGDLDVEGSETFKVLTSNVIGAGPVAPITVDIHEDDIPGPKILLAPASFAEGNSGLIRRNLALSLSEPSPTDLVVHLWTFEPDGVALAVEDEDYLPLPSDIVIPAGQTTGAVPIDVVGDTTREHSETLGVVATLDDSGAWDAYRAVALVEIADDEPQPTLSLAPVQVQEGDDDEVVAHFKAVLSAAQPDDAWFSFRTVAGTATAGVDFEDVHRSGLVIRAGQTELDIPVIVRGDRIAEGSEQFSAQLISPFQVAFGSATATADILDDDAATGISVTGVTQPEGNGAGIARFLVELAAAQVAPVTVDVRTSDGTAFAGHDYSAVAFEGLKIAAGQTRLWVDVPVLGDKVPEADETFGLEIVRVVGATPVRSRALARLVNDDVPTVSISDGSAVEGTGSWESYRTMRFDLTLSAPATREVTVWLRLGDQGTATAGWDVDASRVSLPVVIDPGRTRRSIELRVVGDDLPEGDETFELVIAGAHGALPGDATGIGTIIDDDAVAPTATASTSRAKARQAVTRARPRQARATQ